MQYLSITSPLTSDIFNIGGGVFSVALALVGVYVLYKSVRIFLLFRKGGLGAYRADLQLRSFERRYKRLQKRRNYYRAYYQWERAKNKSSRVR